MLTEAQAEAVMKACGWWRWPIQGDEVPKSIRDGISHIVLVWTGEGYELTPHGAFQYLYWARAKGVDFSGDEPLKDVETRIVSELNLEPAEVLAGSNPLEQHEAHKPPL